ncbi:uncharacterized protein PRCAT00001664001 [Priceomyces carsonii]|uniref:uncharacterized protein n=1 Tax=Priceomyces carsonii TaxID=28549 RepID=UPI002ED95CD6|nr:unnamed protein product [Priceomyces carsonii]
MREDVSRFATSNSLEAMSLQANVIRRIYFQLRRTLTHKRGLSTKLLFDGANQKNGSFENQISGFQSLVKRINKPKKRDTKDITSRESILYLELKEFLKQISSANNPKIDIEQVVNSDSLISTFLRSHERPRDVICNFQILYQTVEGDGLGIIPKSSYAMPYLNDYDDSYEKYSIIKVPKTLIGDNVKVRLMMHHMYYSDSELISIDHEGSKRSSRRNDLIICNKFNECSGCALQMMKYEDQLEFKREVIKKAYKFFYPSLEIASSESFGVVIGSPMQFAYRNKLTPHFNLQKKTLKHDVSMGFNNVNPTKGIVDIEYCPIASNIINDHMNTFREQEISLAENSQPTRKQKWGHTMLMRESIKVDPSTGHYEEVCLSNPKSVVTVKIGDFVFQFPASEFFQNNSHILPYVLDFISTQINDRSQGFKYLIDTYCGSGFFGISLSRDLIQIGGKVLGIEISKKSIMYAEHNAKLNGINVPESAEFIEGSADSIFSNAFFNNANVKGENSIVIIDPSRKGTDLPFIRQLLSFKPKLVFYVSCNVFTQARDLSIISQLQDEYNANYKVKKVVGFDFFPQTKHVESVAVLELQVN